MPDHARTCCASQSASIQSHRPGIRQRKRAAFDILSPFLILRSLLTSASTRFPVSCTEHVRILETSLHQRRARTFEERAEITRLQENLWTAPAVAAFEAQSGDGVPTFAATVEGPGPQEAIGSDLGPGKSVPCQTLRRANSEDNGAIQRPRLYGASCAQEAFELLAYGSEAEKARVEAAKPLLVGPLRDTDPAVRAAALHSLSAIRKLSRDDVLALAAGLSDPDAKVRRTAAGVINYIAFQGTDAIAAAPELEVAVQDSDSHVRSNAAMALGRIGSKRPSTVACLVGMLANGNRDERKFRPVVALGMIGPAAKSAAPALRPMLKDGKASTRAAAAWALWRASGDPEASVPVLIECLGSRRRIAVPGVESPLTGPDEDVRRLAAAALSEIAHSGAAGRGIVDRALKRASFRSLRRVCEGHWQVHRRGRLSC